MRLGRITSGTWKISLGGPQRCVLSPLLFSLYTNECTSNGPSVSLVNFADEMTVNGLTKDRDGSAYRHGVNSVVQSEEPGADYAENSRDVNGLQKDPVSIVQIQNQESIRLLLSADRVECVRRNQELTQARRQN